jgi:DNA replication protein DnaC
MKNTQLSEKQIARLKQHTETWETEGLRTAIDTIAVPNRKVWTFLKTFGQHVELERYIEIDNFNFYLFGGSGVGKTVLAARLKVTWMKQEWLKYGKDGLPESIFISETAILQELRDCYVQGGKSEGEVLRAFQKVRLLVIDDIGSQKLTDWVYTILYSIVDYRDSAMLPTIFTSNLSLEDLAAFYNSDRITSRIKGNCKENVIKVGGKDFRI